jgi:hypothetical protein
LAALRLREHQVPLQHRALNPKLASLEGLKSSNQPMAVLSQHQPTK